MPGTSLPTTLCMSSFTCCSAAVLKRRMIGRMCPSVVKTYLANCLFTGLSVSKRRYRYLQVSLRKKLSMRSSSDLSCTLCMVAYPQSALVKLLRLWRMSRPTCR
uniref:Putative secreted protein n=1 Tax=Ixodes ricinus TaxID=34613 RepID=A0A6B0UG14_IXORI